MSAVAHVIQVIEVKTTRGDGTEASPMRHVMQYFSFGGTLLAEYDPVHDAALPERWMKVRTTWAWDKEP